jgi:hypothetical protein
MFYVYELVDPRDDRVFYVGKGCGARDCTTLRHGNLAKLETVAAIQSAGHKVAVRRFAEGLSHAEALKLERERILYHGYANLTNIAPGRELSLDQRMDRVNKFLNRLIEPPLNMKDGVRFRLWYLALKGQGLMELLRLKERARAGPRQSEA